MTIAIIVSSTATPTTGNHEAAQVEYFRGVDVL
jgi:hypothetical protein